MIEGREKTTNRTNSVAQMIPTLNQRRREGPCQPVDWAGARDH